LHPDPLKWFLIKNVGEDKNVFESVLKKYRKMKFDNFFGGCVFGVWSGDFCFLHFKAV